MKKSPWIIGSLALLTVAACGGSGTTTMGTGGGTTATSSSSSTSSGTGLAGTGGGPVFTLCNPFTGAPCDVAGGQTCDWDGASFSCFDPPNDAKLCDDCGPGNYCVAGMTCLDSNKCTPFCCDDADCGTGATCDKTRISDPHVGVCVAASSGTGGGDGGVGGGDGGTTIAEPACNAPETPPSAGACYMAP